MYLVLDEVLQWAAGGIFTKYTEQGLLAMHNI